MSSVGEYNGVAYTLNLPDIGCRPNRFYWEGVLMLKKGLLVTVAAVFANSEHFHQQCKDCW